MSKRLLIGIVIGLIALAIFTYVSDWFKEEKSNQKTDAPNIPHTAKESAGANDYSPLPELPSSPSEEPQQKETEDQISFQPVESFLPPLAKGRTIIPKVDSFKAAYIKEPIVLLRHSHFKLDPNYLPKAGEYFYLQVKNSLSVESEQTFKQLGIKLIEYIPHKTWIASIKDSKNLFQLKVLADVYAIGEIDPRDKLEESLLKGQFYSYAVDSQKRVVTVVVKFRNQKARSELMTGTPEEIAKLALRPDVSWVEQKPPPPILYNQTGAASSRIDQLQASKLSGKGLVIGIWDGDFVKPHPEFVTRVIDGREDKGALIEDRTSNNLLNLTHAMHVAGTLVGNGSLNPRTRGMADQAILYSEDFNGDRINELRKAILKHQVTVSNHSYGIGPIGWHRDSLGIWRFVDNQSLFGKYSDESASMDKLVFETDHILVKAAGNEGDDIGDGARPRDGKFDTIPGDGSVAKNVITVGSVDNATEVSSFSSYGPTDDGRIKPDIVAKGRDIISTYASEAPCPPEAFSSIPSNKLHCSLSGTSMATPIVTGAIALLMERYGKIPAAIIKAAVIHGAHDIGPKGPDYESGWGLLDAKASLEVLERHGSSWMEISFQEPNEEKILQFYLEKPQENIKTTIAWLDPSAHPGSALALVYNYDSVLLSSAGEKHFPWVKDPTRPSLPAFPQPNQTDNVEQIFLKEASIGTYQLKIKAPANLSEKHSVAVIVSVANARMM